MSIHSAALQENGRKRASVASKREVATHLWPFFFFLLLHLYVWGRDCSTGRNNSHHNDPLFRVGFRGSCLRFGNSAFLTSVFC